MKTRKEIESKMLDIEIEYNKNTAWLHSGLITWNEWDMNATNLYNEYRSLKLKLNELSK